jgi:hypothetical protein
MLTYPKSTSEYTSDHASSGLLDEGRNLAEPALQTWYSEKDRDLEPWPHPDPPSTAYICKTKKYREARRSSPSNRTVSVVLNSSVTHKFWQHCLLVSTLRRLSHWRIIRRQNPPHEKTETEPWRLVKDWRLIQYIVQILKGRRYVELKMDHYVGKRSWHSGCVPCWQLSEGCPLRAPHILSALHVTYRGCIGAGSICRRTFRWSLSLQLHTTPWFHYTAGIHGYPVKHVKSGITDYRIR